MVVEDLAVVEVEEVEEAIEVVAVGSVAVEVEE